MDIIDTHQGKRKDQLRYSNVVVIVGFILIISSVIILKIQQLLNWFSRADEADKEAIGVWLIANRPLISIKKASE